MQNTGSVKTAHVLAKIYRSRLKECAYHKIQQCSDQNYLKLFLYCFFLVHLRVGGPTISPMTQKVIISQGRSKIWKSKIEKSYLLLPLVESYSLGVYEKL